MKYYPTQYRLLRSRGLAERVVLDLRLMDDPRFHAGGGDTAEGEAPPPPGEALIAALANRILAGLSVEPIQQTELVEVSYVSTDPELAARVANGVAEAFIDWGIERRTENVERASTFIAQQIDTLKGEIDAKERQLQEYGRDTDIVNLDPDSNVVLSRLSQLNAGLTDAIGERLEREARYNAQRAAPAETVVQDTTNGLLEELWREALSLEREYETKLKVYKPDWPQMTELRSQIDEVRQNLDRVTRDEADQLRRRAFADYQAALRRERSLEEQIRRVKGEAMDISSAAVEFKNLEMEIANRRELLDDLLGKLSEAGMSARLQSRGESNVRVIDRALTPGSAFRPSLRYDLAFGLASGLGLGIALALLIHFLDRTIKSGEEVERLLGLPVLAVIPDVSEGGRGGRYGDYGYGGGSGSGKRRPRRQEPEILGIELLPESHPRLAVSEAYRSLRTALLLASAERVAVVAVTSPGAGEGKTATSANLAVVLAQLGKRVLLLDADLRKPRLHRIFEVTNRLGLVNCLTGGVEPEAVFQATTIHNLFLCTSGPHPPNPSELLASERMAELLRAARQQFDIVVVDTPPVLMVSDPILVSTISDGVVLCCRAGKVLREDARSCHDRLRMAGVRVLGVVLNRFRPVRGGYYDRRYVYYEAYAEPEEAATADSAA